MLTEELANDPLGVGYAGMTHEQIVSSLNAPTRKQLVPTEIGNGAILETIGLAAGNALLDVIQAQPDFRHVRPLLEQGRIRVDSALVRATLDSLVPAVLTQAQVDSLKALAEKPCSRAEELGIGRVTAETLWNEGIR